MTRFGFQALGWPVVLNSVSLLVGRAVKLVTALKSQLTYLVRCDILGPRGGSVHGRPLLENLLVKPRRGIGLARLSSVPSPVGLSPTGPACAGLSGRAAW